VASIATDAANDASSEVLTLGTIKLAMTDLTAILASLILVVSKGTVESS
jgi:hypothetical protein